MKSAVCNHSLAPVCGSHLLEQVAGRDTANETAATQLLLHMGLESSHLLALSPAWPWLHQAQSLVGHQHLALLVSYKCHGKWPMNPYSL